MLELGLKVLIAYLAGSLNGSLLLGALKGVDVRNTGSGNAGGTNALRTQGIMFAVAVIVVDVGKGFLPAWYLPGAELAGVAIDPGISRMWLMLACGGASIIGHCYPVWFEFRGGKGAATAIGVMLAIAPAVLVPAGIAWLLVLILSGFVGLATISAAITFPAWVGLTAFPERHELFVFTVCLSAFIVYTHRSNIRRMRRGTEGRVERVMVLRRMP